MPRQPTAAETRLREVVSCLHPAIGLLEDLSDAFGTPFVPIISSTVNALIGVVQTAKSNKEDCTSLLEQVHQLIVAIVQLHVRSESTGGTLAPGILRDIGKFTETLQKLYTFVEGQQGGNIFKRIVHHRDLSGLLKDCQAALRYAFDAFKVEMNANLFKDISQVQRMTESAQKDLLDMIAAVSDGDESGKSSSTMLSTQNRPKIFHGREAEIEHIVKILVQGLARIPILGAGGIGKTSLSKAVLYHPDVIASYDNLVFVSCDSVTNSVDLAGLVGSYVGLKAGKDLTKQCTRCLLVLDNLESSWEPLESRSDVEEFLSLLTDLPHLALLVTLRGAERPGKVQWSRPFLLPLQPLPDEAAHQTFIDIADDFHDKNHVQQLLLLTDNMPLAVNLIAHLANDEGCPNVLARWKTERTSIFSTANGRDRLSNLDASIKLSLSSPRILAESGAKDLLGLLSILPDGLSNVELLQSELPIQNALKCKAILLQTALGYSENQRIKVFAPIREHMQHFHPVPLRMTRPVQTYFHSLLELYQKHRGMQQSVQTVQQIRSNAGNLNQILVLGLNVDNPDLAQTIRCTICLNSFRRLMGHSPTVLMDRIPELLPHLDDPGLAAEINVELIHLAEIYAQSIQDTSPEQSPYNHALSLLSAAEIEIIIGAAESEVRPKIALARELFSAQGNQIPVTQCHMVQADLELREGNEAVAEASFCRCLASSWIGNGEIRSYCLERLGDIRRWKKQSTNNWAVVYLADSQTSHNMLALHKALLFIADIFIHAGEDDTASALLVVALDGFTSMDVHRGRAECLLRLGQVSLGRKELPLAVQFWSQARPFFERASQTTKVMHIDSTIAQVEKEIPQHDEGNLAHLPFLVNASLTVCKLGNGALDTSEPEEFA
ncbi:hypothetical protein C8F04DRAFT_1235227 [Mycena alexandri]|uniref:NB-ARC domain-containing protein n=1 Tax=Mycena alexandri TaxID=1745969 RepID=A0AAD6SU20_9AGAR|nr:hypothetical protein C8F04DRAFT_1235227 [Mycena alexandri]